jgi:cysteine desulfurase/selenocysteine lyase
MYQITDISNEFPLLRDLNKKDRYVYFDNSATTQKPDYVLKAISDYYQETNSNIHRGIHKLSNFGSTLYEKAHAIVASFINAENDEVFFVQNCTAGLNYLAMAFEDFEQLNLRKGDVIVTTEMEHHSNILPWMKLAKKKKLIIEWLGVNDKYELEIVELERLYKKHGAKIKILALSHISNVLGVKNDLSLFIKTAHEHNTIVVIDAAQSIAHVSIDVKELDIDFLCFSGHKMYAPMGSGVVYGKSKLLKMLNPVIVGGGMIKDVTKNGADWEETPWKFEAGTPNVADCIGLAVAILWFENTLLQISDKDKRKQDISINPLEDMHNFDRKKRNKKDLLEGWNALISHEYTLMKRFVDTFPENKRISYFGPSDPCKRIGALSFTIEEIHPHDIASWLDESGIAIRSGLHCAHILHKKFNLTATSRVSFAIYNTIDEVDYVTDKINKIIKLL